MRIEGMIWKDKKWVANDLPARVKKSEHRLSGIYAIEIPQLKSVYIGQSVNIQSRWSQHRHVLRKNTCEIKEMQNCWNAHADLFEFKILELTTERMLEKERDFAQKYVEDGYTLFNNYFHVQTKSMLISDEHIPVVTKLLRLITKGRINVQQLDQYLDTL